MEFPASKEAMLINGWKLIDDECDCCCCHEAVERWETPDGKLLTMQIMFRTAQVLDAGLSVRKQTEPVRMLHLCEQ
jgi:hypothetical protein